MDNSKRGKERHCSGCKKLKPYTSFSVDRSRRERRSLICKSCNASRVARTRSNKNSLYEKHDACLEERLSKVYKKAVDMERIRFELVKGFVELGVSEQAAIRIVDKCTENETNTRARYNSRREGP